MAVRFPSPVLLVSLFLLQVPPAPAAGQLPPDVPDSVASVLSQSEWDELRADELRKVGRALERPVWVFMGWSSGEHVQCLGDSDRMANLVEGELRRAGARPTQDFASRLGSAFSMNSVVGVQNGMTCVVAYTLSWRVHHPEDEGTMWSTGLRLVWGPRWDSPQRLRAIVREHVAELGDFLASGLSRLAEDAAAR